MLRFTGSQRVGLGAEQNLLVGSVTLPGVMDAEGLPLSCRGTAPTAYAISTVNMKTCIWWLSDPTQQVKYQNSKRWFASAVKEDGEIVRLGYQINYDGKMARPMITVDLSRLP